MKTIIILLLSLLSFNMLAQVSQKKNLRFIRIFNTNGQKIQKGIVQQVTDSTITVKRIDDFYTVHFSEIGWIKTKRSFGHRLSVITGASASSLALIGLVTTKDSNDGLIKLSPEEMALILGSVGTAYGSLASIIAHLFTKKEKILINGKLDAWNIFKEKYTVISINTAQAKPF